MSVHFAPELEQRLQEFAAQAGRTPDDVAQEAVNHYMQHLQALADEVREGEESAVREGWLTQDEVFARLNHRLRKIA